MYITRYLVLQVLLLVSVVAFQQSMLPQRLRSSHKSSLSMLNPLRDGSIVALITPMNPDCSIDYASYESLLKWHVASGSDGVVILGTTGEGSVISMDDRTKIIKSAVSTTKGAYPIIVGAGSIDTQEAIHMCRNAKDCGADASLIITPYYIKPPQRALIQHYKTIADEVDLPMILYNCPGRTGVNMDIETISKLSVHKNIVGIKDATGDLQRVIEMKSKCSPGFLVYSGEDDSGCEFVSKDYGGNGVISVTANVAPSLMHEMLISSSKGEKEKADKINEMLMPLHKNLFIESNPIPVKRAMAMLGKCQSKIRPPLVELDTTLEEILRDALKAADLL